MKRITLLLLFLAVLAAVPRSALAACPGISTCKLSTCPTGAIQVTPGHSIQAVINSAANGAKICVRPGTYVGNLNFMGKPISLIAANGPGVTFLKGTGTGTVVTFNHFEGADSVLDGFTVTNGKAAFGGGVSIVNASPTLRNLAINHNMATGGTYSRGGGASVSGATAKPSITCVQFAFNQATYAGGALVTSAFADPYLRNTDFEQNTAPYGGAIAAYNSGRLDLGTSSFFSNQATGDGGAIHTGVAYGNVLVRNCWFKGNKANGNGGAVWIPAGLAQIVNCTFDGNQASVGGGLAAGFGGMADVASTLFVNNQTLGGGSSTLVNTSPASNTSVVNHYNGFFANTGGDYLGTYGDLGPLTLDPQIGTSCCPAAGSPAIRAGIPDYLFNNVSGSRNDMGACGGPAI
jgi:predicted outer membrane repeat protein